jgi:hypothetical protein
MNDFGFGVGVGVGFGFAVAECLATARFSTLGDGSGDVVGDGGVFGDFPSAFGESTGAAASIGLEEETGVGLGVGIDSGLGLRSGATL